MKCTNCGTENEAGRETCVNCGAPLTAAAAAPVGAMASSTVTPEAPATPEMPVETEVRSTTTTAPPPQRSNGSKGDALGAWDGATTRLETMTAPYQQYMQSVGRAAAPLAPLGKQNAAWIGAVLLIIGVFLPIQHFSVLFISADWSYWDINKFWSTILILIGVGSAFAVYRRQFVWLWPFSVLSLLIVLIEFIRTATDSLISPYWGFIVLFLGCLVLLAAAGMSAVEETRTQRAI